MVWSLFTGLLMSSIIVENIAITPLSVAFGELDISPLTVILLISISVFVFLGVAISSLKLFQGAADAIDDIDD